MKIVLEPGRGKSQLRHNCCTRIKIIIIVVIKEIWTRTVVHKLMNCASLLWATVTGESVSHFSGVWGQNQLNLCCVSHSLAHHGLERWLWIIEGRETGDCVGALQDTFEKSGHLLNRKEKWGRGKRQIHQWNEHSLSAPGHFNGIRNRDSKVLLSPTLCSDHQWPKAGHWAQWSWSL
jgi:hypothetical protein